jgi:hypothetical protein
LLTASEDGCARLWEPPDLLEGTLPQLAIWVRVATGLDMDAGGAVQLLDEEGWRRYHRRVQEWGRGQKP